MDNIAQRLKAYIEVHPFDPDENNFDMNPDAPIRASISEANKDFSRVIQLADKYGRVVIFKENKPKYLLVDLEQETLIYDLTDEEKVEIASKRIFKQHKPAFEEFAK